MKIVIKINNTSWPINYNNYYNKKKFNYIKEIYKKIKKLKI